MVLLQHNKLLQEGCIHHVYMLVCFFYVFRQCTILFCICTFVPVKITLRMFSLYTTTFTLFATQHFALYWGPSCHGIAYITRSPFTHSINFILLSFWHMHSSLYVFSHTLHKYTQAAVIFRVHIAMCVGLPFPLMLWIIRSMIITVYKLMYKDCWLAGVQSLLLCVCLTSYARKTLTSL